MLGEQHALLLAHVFLVLTLYMLKEQNVRSREKEKKEDNREGRVVHTQLTPPSISMYRNTS